MSEIQSTTCSETNRTFMTSEAARAGEQRFREIQAECEAGQVPELRPGDVIYIDTQIYLGHGRDDFHGGLVEVIEFNKGSTPFVVVAKERQSAYNWKLLSGWQTKLRSKFGKTWSYPDPDTRPEFNEDSR
jgi:hypothetical protein